MILPQACVNLQYQEDNARYFQKLVAKENLFPHFLGCQSISATWMVSNPPIMVIVLTEELIEAMFSKIVIGY
jgi:hypothetical protein